MSFLDDLKKQPKHVREIMFGLCVVITVALVGMIWFRSFEENIFVMINPEKEKQDLFFAERSKDAPIIYANVTKALSGLRATMYNAFGFLDENNVNEIKIDEEYQGEIHKLPLSGDR